MESLPPDIKTNPLLDGPSYAQRLQYFHMKSKKLGTLSSGLLLVGHGCSLKVSHDLLLVQQRSFRGEKVEPLLLYPGLHKIKQIVFLSPSGFITIDALRWCKNQGISLLMLDELGNMIYSVFPECRSAVRLRRRQYRVCETELGVSFVRELLR